MLDTLITRWPLLLLAMVSPLGPVPAANQPALLAEAASPAPAAAEPFDEVGLLVADPCEGEACADLRYVFIDYDALGIEGQLGGEWIGYDFHEVTRPVESQDLALESEISLAVRLIVSEVGADRLLVSRFALLESIGILYTVDNRLDPEGYNPQDEPQAPVFPGCGPNGTFGTCTNSQQYLGMATWRALNPAARYDHSLLEEAVDVAVTAWWLQENGYVADFTEGATNYVHRCGGAAYGMTTYHCDAHSGGSRRDDVRGANPFTGPIVFKAPTVYLERKGFYGIRESRRLEYDPRWDFAAIDNDGYADASDELHGPGEDPWGLPPSRVPGFTTADPMAADASMAALIAGYQPTPDRDAMLSLMRAYRPELFRR